MSNFQPRESSLERNLNYTRSYNWVPPKPAWKSKPFAWLGNSTGEGPSNGYEWCG